MTWSKNSFSKRQVPIFITFGMAVIPDVAPVVAADRDILTIAQLDGATETNSAVKLKAFIIDIDDMLSQRTRDITNVNAIIYRYFALQGCNADEASHIVKRSKYFRGVGMNGPKTHVFSLNSETAFSRGVSVTFSLIDGETHHPLAL